MFYSLDTILYSLLGCLVIGGAFGLLHTFRDENNIIRFFYHLIVAILLGYFIGTAFINLFLDLG